MLRKMLPDSQDIFDTDVVYTYPGKLHDLRYVLGVYGADWISNLLGRIIPSTSADANTSHET